MLGGSVWGVWCVGACLIAGCVAATRLLFFGCLLLWLLGWRLLRWFREGVGEAVGYGVLFINIVGHAVECAFNIAHDFGVDGKMRLAMATRGFLLP